MTQKSCAVGMRNAILRNHLKLQKHEKISIDRGSAGRSFLKPFLFLTRGKVFQSFRIVIILPFIKAILKSLVILAI